MNQSLPSSTDAENFLAKWVYEQLALLRDQTLGPALRMPEYAFDVYDALQPSLERIVGPQRTTGRDTVMTVPTPWHATLALESLQHYFTSQQRRAVFRGQADSNWQIISSIARDGIDLQREKLRASLFCDILGAMSFGTVTSMSPRFGTLNLRIPKESYYAAAQHYGIRTDLIDVTSDAAVAVSFAATHPAPSPECLASVYVLDLDLALDHGCSIVVPPPFVERLHKQRGFFIKHGDVERPIGPDDGVVMEVRFPANFDFKPFRVIRRDTGIVDLLTPNGAIDSLLTMIDKLIDGHDESELQSADLISDAASRMKPQFDDIYRDPLLMWGQYVDAFEDMLYWTAYFAADSLAIDRNILAHIANDNKHLVNGVVQLYTWMMNDPKFEYTEDRRRFRGDLISMLREPLPQE
ncbi:FRG domain protein [Prosthecochloris aestuarii DSM 271]|uniref:FRG domain protein n=1 Tax=Prosthecochloris aestuarii (strain DSM 271 / SK 413) TaxID=290512 RepID=B4S6W2_PROA2|nr:FRG domain-containing protein [Prosthecochloris aestuarii]ACF47317.1 FRG domain protein [Prosthecochloris aestuarii DSM 271]